MRKIYILLVLLLLAIFTLSPVCYAADVPDGDYAISGSDEGAFEFEDEYSKEQMEQLATVVTGTNYRCRVVEVLDDTVEKIDGGGYTIDSHIQTLRVLIKEGPYKGMTAVVTYDLSDTWGGGNEPDPAKKGDLLIAQFTPESDGSLKGLVTQYGRENSLIWLAAIFLVLLAIFGGRRGARSIFALVLTCVGLVFVMIPAMVKGANPIIAAVLGSLFAIAVTLVIVYGFTIKTLAASLGALGGVLTAGILVAIMNVAMNMTGLVDDESMYLAQSVGDGSINLRQILFAAIIIGVLGGTIDVGISIASALDELRLKADNITGAEMMMSGINIGIDIMGASLNTLILAYVGGSIHLLMLFYTYNNPMVMIINDEMIACELLRALAGSFGLLLTVPITSFVAAAMMCKGKFGKLNPDCFVTLVVIKRFVRRVKGFFTRPAADASTQAIPENLYQNAVRHRIDLEESGVNVDDGYEDVEKKGQD